MAWWFAWSITIRMISTRAFNDRKRLSTTTNSQSVQSGRELSAGSPHIIRDASSSVGSRPLGVS